MLVSKLKDGEKLGLSTDGELHAFFLGVGSMFATKHYQTNFLLMKGENHVLVDFGMTGPAALAATAGIPPAAIEYFLPSHGHEDHVGGCGYLALTNRYIGIPFMKRPKTKLIITDEYEPVLWERSLRGSLEWNEIDENGRPLALADYFEIVHPQPAGQVPRRTWKITVGELKLELFRTVHIPDQARTVAEAFISYGLFVDDRIFFSCDSQFDQELIEWYDERGAECFFHDVQFFPGAVHAPLTDLRTLPAGIKSRMYLKHYADNYDQQDISDFAGWTKQGAIYNFG